MKDVPSIELLSGGSPLCSGCGASLGLRLGLKVLGKNTIVVNSAGCLTLLAHYPYMPVHVPWIHVAIENAGAVARGINAAYRQLKKKAKVFCYIGDGATYDIGFQSLSYAIERGEDMVYVCYNNNAFMNTGIQASTATPFGAFTTTTPEGKIRDKKPIVKILAAHGIPYAASACVSYPLDYMRKLQKAKKIKGPAFIDLLTPCVPGWGMPEHLSYKSGRLAVDTGFWPLYEIEGGKFSLTHKPPKLSPIKDFLRVQKRYKHLNSSEIKKIQKRINREWKLLKEGKYWETSDF